MSKKCEKCGKVIEPGEKYFTAVGVVQCEECDVKDNHSVSLDFVISKISKIKQ